MIFDQTARQKVPSFKVKIPNQKTQAAMRDADAWVIEMRAKESQPSPSNISTLVKKESLYSGIFSPEIY